MGSDAAKDSVQEFFAHVLKTSWLGGVREGEGRFRNFLRITFENFARNYQRSELRARRRGGRHHASLDEAKHDVPDPRTWNSGRVWDEAWRRTLLERALALLQNEFRGKGREAPVRLFKRYYVDRDHEPIDYRMLSQESGIALTDVANQLHLARLRYREILVDLVRQTTASLEEARAEFRELFGMDMPERGVESREHDVGRHVFGRFGRAGRPRLPRSRSRAGDAP
jgi:DNA-directed RNA polymerase specialized sigma24 family protein